MGRPSRYSPELRERAVRLARESERGIAPTPVHIVSARLGHSSPMVTLSVYAHCLPTSDEQAATVIGDLLAPSR